MDVESTHVNMTVSLTLKTRTRLDDHAKQTAKPKSHLVERAINEFLDREVTAVIE